MASDGATFEVLQTASFSAWIGGLRDRRAAEAVAQRISRFRRGLFGDVKPVGGGVNEARIHLGPGYRVYHLRRGERVVVLLCGGDKGSQASDILVARAMARELE